MRYSSKLNLAGLPRRMRRAIVAQLRKFSHAKDGNIAMMVGLLAPVIFLFAGGAVDFTRMNSIRTDLIESLDAAGLAIAQMDALNPPEISSLSPAAREAYLKDYGRAFFNENFAYENQVIDLQVDFDLSTATITPVASGRIKTLLLGAADINYFNLNADTEITRRGSGKIELALVLDVSGSMASSINGERKIVSMRDAVENLLEVLYGERDRDPNIKVGVVPFNAFVNPGGSPSWQSAWTDESAEATYHGAHFIHVDATGTVDTSAVALAQNPTGVARVMDPDRKVNHFDLYRAHSNLNWKGCVEARPYPLDEIDTRPGVATDSTTLTAALQVPASLANPTGVFRTRARQAFDRAPALALPANEVGAVRNSRWVPYFAPDEPDCGSNSSPACRWGENVNGVNDTDTPATVVANYTLGSTPRAITTSGFMYDDPDNDFNDLHPDSGNRQIAEGAYGNRTFILDRRYSRMNSGNGTASPNGARFPRYAEVVNGFRVATQPTTSGLDSYWLAVRDRLAAMRATDFGNDEYILRMAYPGWHDSANNRYIGKYDQSPSVFENQSDSGTSSRGPNRDCPAPILALTDERENVEDHVEELFPGGNTNIAAGAMWGWRVLSSAPPFTEGVSENDLTWQKAVVIMTDGENVASGASTHWESAPTYWGYSIEGRMGAGVNRPARGGSSFQSARMAHHIDEKLLRVCERMKNEGILVYSIIFNLNNSSVETMMKACATSPSAPYFFNAPSGAELETAFGAIAADLVRLHVSR